MTFEVGEIQTLSLGTTNTKMSTELDFTCYQFKVFLFGFFSA